PVDGKANAHLSKYLAKQCKVAKGLIDIEKGELGRHKQIRIHTPAQIPPEVQAILD
ncbi:MAG: YggU family protein, partial [Vibrionaceae bacterium]